MWNEKELPTAKCPRSIEYVLAAEEEDVLDCDDGIFDAFPEDFQQVLNEQPSRHNHNLTSTEPKDFADRNLSDEIEPFDSCDIDQILSDLMQADPFQRSKCHSEDKILQDLEGLLHSVCREIESCYPQKHMRPQNQNIYEPVRRLRQPFPCAPPKIFIRGSTNRISTQAEAFSDSFSG